MRSVVEEGGVNWCLYSAEWNSGMEWNGIATNLNLILSLKQFNYINWNWKFGFIQIVHLET